ncbi:glycosyltransferase family 2 protein [Flavobacterium notoginsengisoli]|uniref:glycosyltransferase family 2 protein n=1 Tax=Flavobacterium notoginsengisoli TaxID=1478199 RepID=UPI00362E3E79
MNEKIFVIIVTYNGMNWIEKCLKSVLNSSISSDIIVIDNCSTDGTIEFIESNFKEVLLVKQDKNLGFGAANNIGFDIALANGGEYFVLLNQDAYLEKYTLEILVGQIKQNPDFGVLSPIHLNGNGDEIDFLFQFYISSNNCRNFYSDVFLQKTLKEIYNVNFINAAIWILSKSTLEKIGGFNPYFFHYAEDNDYINRCQFKKMKVGIVPKAIAYHDRILNQRKFTLKTFTNLRDLKLMNPNNKWSVNRMTKYTIRESIISIIKLNKSELRYNFFYLKKIIKNYKAIKHIQKQSKFESYSFLNYKEN